MYIYNRVNRERERETTVYNICAYSLPRPAIIVCVVTYDMMLHVVMLCST